MNKCLTLLFCFSFLTSFLSVSPMIMNKNDIKEKIESMLSENADLDILIGNTTPLIFAAHNNYIKLFEKCIASGADVNFQDIDGSTALLKAVEKGNTEIIRLLINLDAQDIPNKNDVTALALAKEYYLTTIVALLSPKNTQEQEEELFKLLENKEKEKLQKKEEKEKIKIAKKIKYEKKSQKFRRQIVAGIETVKQIINSRRENHLMHAKLAAIFKPYKENIKSSEKKSQIDSKKPSLINAVLSDDLECIIKLTEDPTIDVNERDCTGWSALANAILIGNIETVKVLINHEKIDIDATLPNGTTPLMIAASHKQFEISRLLIEKHADIDAVSNNGSTPLIAAVQYGSPKNAYLLITLGVEVNAQDKWGCSALYYAVKKGKFNLVKSLIAHGADVNVKDNENCGLLLCAALNVPRDTEESQKSQEYLSIVKYLVKNGAQIEDESEETSPLYRGHKEINQPIVEFLRKKLKKIQQKINYTKTIAKLSQAIENDDVVGIQDIILSGFEVNSSLDEEGNNLLLIAINKKKNKIIEWLIVLPDINLNKTNHNRETPLIRSICTRNWKVVDFLIDLGVSISTRDINGKTAITHAAEKNRYLLIQKLEKLGGDIEDFKKYQNNSNMSYQPEAGLKIMNDQEFKSITNSFKDARRVHAIQLEKDAELLVTHDNIKEFLKAVSPRYN